MFCKYCGKPMTGAKCSACGKETILSQYSTELDNLMTSGTAVCLKNIPEKTYQQGLDEGYQQGLSDGYRNGLNDGAGNTAETSVRTISKTVLIAACAAVFLIGTVSSWMISSRINFEQGKKEGEAEAKSASEIYYSEQLEIKYWQGYADGESKGNAESEAMCSPSTPAETPSAQTSSVIPASPTPFPEQNEVLCSSSVNKQSQSVKDVQNALIELGQLFR